MMVKRGLRLDALLCVWLGVLACIAARDNHAGPHAEACAIHLSTQILHHRPPRIASNRTRTGVTCRPLTVLKALRSGESSPGPSGERLWEAKRPRSVRPGVGRVLRALFSPCGG